MSEIDAGGYWRRVKMGEVIEAGDEYLDERHGWKQVPNFGMAFTSCLLPHRRRVPAAATPAPPVVASSATTASHPWCRDVAAAAAVRAAEPADTLPEHRELPGIVAELRDRFDDIETTHCRALDRCSDRIDALEAADGKAAADNARLGAANEDLACRLDAAIRERDEARTRLDSVTVESNRRLTMCEQFKSERDTGRFHAKCLQARVAELESSAKLAPAANADAESNDRVGTDMGNGVFVASAEEVLAMCRDTQARLTDERDAARRERDEARTECERLRKQLETLEPIAKAHEAAIKAAERFNAEQAESETADRASLYSLLDAAANGMHAGTTELMRRAVCSIVDERDKARARVAELEAAGRDLRRLLAMRVAGAGLYGDDGELQDNSVLPAIDFMRDTPAEIEQKIQDRAMQAVSAPASEAGTVRALMLTIAHIGGDGKLLDYGAVENETAVVGTEFVALTPAQVAEIERQVSGEGTT